MALHKEVVGQVLKKFRRNELDTGSTEIQVALLTTRILQLTEHFKIHKKDNHGRLGLVKMVSKRRKLLKYLKSNDLAKYNETIKELGLRK